MIEGVIITPKKQIEDDRGKIMHMMRNDDSIFQKFGEVYFSVVYPSKIKAWHIHKKMTLNYVVVSGEVKIVLYDDRKNSSTFNEVQEVFLTEKNYCMITIPPLIWNGFKSNNNKLAIISNLSDIPHDPEEIIRKDPNDKYFPYSW